MAQAQKPNWQYPLAAPPLKDGKPRIEGDLLARWQKVTVQIHELATANGWSKAEASRRADMVNGTFNQIYDGTYAGNFESFIEKLENWIASSTAMNALIDIMPVEPAFVMTKTAQRIMQGLQYAQAAPEMVTISTGAGCGKSSVCRHFRDTSPHAYLVTMRPRTKSTHNMLSEIAHELKIKKGAVDMLDRNIGEKLRRNGQKPILIIDEAQNLTNEAIDQLRYLLDVYECGIALVGNDEIYTRFAQKNGPSFAQLRRRIGMRINITRVAPEDIEAMIAAWRVEDEDIAGLLRAIGNKPGALGHITKTMQLAGMIANGEGRPLTARDVQQAWSNRGAEG